MTTIGDYQRHMRRRDLADGTIVRRRQHLQAFAGWLEADILLATSADIETFLDARDAQGRTRYCWLSDLSQFYGWAVKHEYATANPVAKIDRPKLAPLLPRPIADRDLVFALEQAERSRTMLAWLSLFAFAGLRVGEVAGLETGGVIFSERMLRVLGKGRKERIIPLHPRVEAALQSHGLPRSGAIFTRPRGGRYPAGTVSREVSEFFTDIGVNATAHQLRHWFATQVLRACGNLRTVQVLMGHADVSTTAPYTRFQMDEATVAVRALDLVELDGAGPILLAN